MDPLEDDSDPLVGESQPTQLLERVLDGGMDPSSRIKDPHSSTHGEEHDTTKNPSNDSLTSSRLDSSSAPRYHFHGLATTQTQTQHCDDDDGTNEGSQKENINATSTTGEARTTVIPRLGSPHASSSRNIQTKVPHVEQSSHSPSRATAKKPKPTAIKAVAFQSPRATTRTEFPPTNPTDLPSKTRYPTYTPRTNTTTRPNHDQFSQDSFAGPLSQDPEQQFLAVSKQFEVPLSELGRVSLTAEETSGEHTSDSPMFAYSARTRAIARLSSSPQGRVLVAATPSSSGSSQSQERASQLSQNFGQSPDADTSPQRQPLDMAYDDNDNVAVDYEASQQSTQRYESTEPSSSYGRFVNGEPDPDTATLVMEYQATQPSTQLDVDMTAEEGLAAAINTAWGTATTGRRTTTSGGPSNTSGGPAASCNTHSTAPKTILSMVDPRKNWRYAQYQQILPSVNRGMHTPAASGNTGPSPLMQETQPSGEDENNSASAPSRGFAFRNQAHPNPPSPPPKPNKDLLAPEGPSRYRQPLSNDTMDVVPDSEPLRDDDDRTATRGANRGATGRPVKRGFRPMSPGADPDPKFGDTVPDSVAVDDDEAMTEDDDDDDRGRGKAQAEKEEEEEEEDIPLAAVTSKRGTGKEVSTAVGKAKAVPRASREVSKMAPPPSIPKGKQPARGPKPKETPPKTAVAKGKQKQAPAARPSSDADMTIKDTRKRRAPAPAQKKPQGQGESWDMGEVPSSAPDQDLNNARSGPSSKAKLKPSKLAKGDKPPAPKSNARTRSTSTTSTAAKRRRVAAGEDDVDDDDDDDNQLSESDDELLIPKAEDDGEEGTEPADEDYMDADFHGAGPSSRKRKRGAKTTDFKVSKADSRVSTKSNKPSFNTPSTRQTKRLRSVVSTSASRSGVGAATRVFALWKQDGHYYSGVVHSIPARSRYLVEFDDATQGTINIDQMRQCELRVGDDVIIAGRSRSAKVVNLVSDNVVSVNVDDEYLEVEMPDIRIASKTISYAWMDRKLSPESIVTIVKPARPLKSSPSPSKQSVLSTASSRRKVFAKIGLVVTLSAGNENWERDKDRVMLAIKNNGGTVIDDWASIIRMDGKHSHSNQRWIVHKDQVQWNGKEGIDRVFLLADDANQKPKYLIALALGIPCLSVNWLHDSAGAGDERDWMGYMLPQGFSEHLNARVSQLVDLDWGNSIHHLTDIMSNQVASKIFADQSVLCVSVDFVPLPKGKKITGPDEKSREASSAVPRIILSMGARRVEAVTELKFASDQPSTFDYVVIKDVDHYVQELEDCTAVHLAWVKDCLIAGRRLPLPELL